MDVNVVLRHLEAAGFDGAPRLLGIDEHGREMLTHLDGETIDSSPATLSDAPLVSAAQPVRRFHDTTAGTALAAAEEIVAHGDLGPHNHGVQRRHGGRDHRLGRGCRPGSRLVDFARGVVLRRRLRARHSRSPSRPARFA
jgi:hypothetical protein